MNNYIFPLSSLRIAFQSVETEGKIDSKLNEWVKLSGIVVGSGSKHEDALILLYDKQKIY
jgi:hypothetical protein